MSTRSNIFIRTDGDLHQYYHHHDGYLEGVGRFLVKALVESLQHGEDPELYLLKQMRDEGRYEYEGKEFSPHGDVEYMYLIDFQDDEVQIGYKNSKPGDYEALDTLPKAGKVEEFIDEVNQQIKAANERMLQLKEEQPNHPLLKDFESEPLLPKE